MDQRRGWCPSLWTPMESGDGLIVRLDVRADGLAPAEVRAVQALASRHGNGLIEITRRGRLQLRGIRAATLEPLQRALVDLGLASTTPSRIVLNPLPECVNLAPLATELECALEAVGPLPDKFVVALDRGGLLQALGADLRLDVAGGFAEIRAAETPLGHCRSEDCATVVSALAQHFADQAEPEHRRMREFVRSRGPQALARVIESWLHEAPEAASDRALTALNPALIGVHHGDGCWLGLGLPFGTGDAEAWLAIADIAERFGTGTVHITPFRSVIVAGADATEAVFAAEAAGLIVDPSDPLLRAVACPGTPACSRAHGETRAFARELATSVLPLLAAEVRLHVSGCSKGCAQTAPASITLVHGAEGVHLGFDCNPAAATAAPEMHLSLARSRLFGLALAPAGSQARTPGDPSALALASSGAGE